jgi:hypothetical protein
VVIGTAPSTVVLHRLCSRLTSVLRSVKDVIPQRKANSSRGRQRRMPRVWIDTVQEKRPYTACCPSDA